MAMHTELWFPQVIWSAIVNTIDNNELKKFAYQVKAQDPQGRILSNYTGYQSKDIVKGTHPQIDRLVDYLDEEIAECCRQVGLPELQIYNLWININSGNGSYNDLHHHIGSVLSGVYYVDAAPDQGNIDFERSDNAEYHLPERVEKATYFTSSKATYAAKTNALYVFPSWLKHKVQGNFSKKDRISIAFNYGEKT